jgi:hypothetical protein
MIALSNHLHTWKEASIYASFSYTPTMTDQKESVRVNDMDSVTTTQEYPKT